jgi:hypothetical protein
LAFKEGTRHYSGGEVGKSLSGGGEVEKWRSGEMEKCGGVKECSSGEAEKWRSRQWRVVGVEERTTGEMQKWRSGDVEE